MRKNTIKSEIIEFTALRPKYTVMLMHDIVAAVEDSQKMDASPLLPALLLLQEIAAHIAEAKSTT